MEKFTIKEALTFGWHKTKKHFWYLVPLLLGTMIFFSLLDAFVEDMGILINIAAGIIGILAEIAWLKISLKILNDEKISLREAYSNWRTFLNYCVGGLLYGLIVLGGLILLIVPGIIWGLKYSQYAYLIIDKGLGPIEALKESGRITSGAKGKLLLLGLSSIGVVLLGVLALVVGILWAIPTAMIAWAYVYRKLANSVFPVTTPLPALSVNPPLS